MKQKLRNYFIGRHLMVADPFGRANAIMLYQFTLAFFLIFLFQLLADIMLGFDKATIKHSIDVFLLATIPFVIRYVRKLQHAANYFFFAIAISSFVATMMLNPERVDAICIAKVMFFISMGALLLEGLARILFCCYFGWLPLLYIGLNTKLNGALTWDWIAQPGAEESPVFLILIPMVLGTYSIWNYTKTIRQARSTMVLQSKIIEERNAAITDSIKYAKRIQQARLPDKKDIHSVFPDSFVLFMPKDIVSGDFYFFHKSGPRVFIAAADCTGHGVPGALMSMACSEKLGEAISQTKNISEILKRLNVGLKASFHQFGDKDSTTDGMDIALCAVDIENYIVNYTGANRPLWIVRKGEREVKELKATKKAIGGFTEDAQNFESHEIQLQPGDTFYIFSDGYADTFGGEAGKKLTTAKFRKILISIQHLSMKDQEAHLGHFIEDWKSDREQIDDILVIGVRL